MHADRDCIGLFPGASQKKLNSRAHHRIQFESTTMAIAFNKILPFFFYSEDVQTCRKTL